MYSHLPKSISQFCIYSDYFLLVLEISNDGETWNQAIFFNSFFRDSKNNSPWLQNVLIINSWPHYMKGDEEF